MFSARQKPARMSPFAIEAMQRRGIDISRQRSKHLSEYLDQPFDTVITVCDQAAETCSIFPGKAERIHWCFPDPAAVEGSDEEILTVFEQVRNDLESKLSAWVSEHC